jgi:hypothetical protein
MEHKWGAYMGRLIFEDCAVSLERPMKLLRVFEKAGQNAEERDEFLEWRLPITDFPVVQHYAPEERLQDGRKPFHRVCEHLLNFKPSGGSNMPEPSSHGKRLEVTEVCQADCGR